MPLRLPATVPAPPPGIPSADLTFPVPGTVGGIAAVDLDGCLRAGLTHPVTETAGNVSLCGAAHGNTDLGLTAVVA